MAWQKQSLLVCNWAGLYCWTLGTEKEACWGLFSDIDVASVSVSVLEF